MSIGPGPSVPSVTHDAKRLAENERIRNYRRAREAKDPAYKASRRKATSDYRATAAGRAAWCGYFAQLRTDPSFAVQCALRSRLYEALKGNLKTSTTMTLVGCTAEQLRTWLEARFTPGMSWENYGSWEVDHKRPCSSFDLADPKQQRECFHHTNLQPLWRRDNRLKGNTLLQEVA